MGLLISLAHYGGCDLKSAGQAHSLYSRCLGYALPMVLSTNFPCSQWALIPNERSSFMKVAGIIAEYNPFHKGHQYHIEETRKKTGADYVVVVMSGDYVQRGEPAIADKYMRTRMALSGGADLIIEMPAIYATASAEYFATAGIGILDQLGCVDYLSFGSEWAEVEDFSAYATLFLEEPEEYKQILQEKLKSGKSFPEARAFAA